jgi:hypothetical protein
MGPTELSELDRVSSEVVSDPMSPMNTVDLRRGEGLLGLVVHQENVESAAFPGSADPRVA